MYRNRHDHFQFFPLNPITKCLRHALCKKISNFKTAFVFELADDLLHPLIIAVQCLSARYDKLSFCTVFTKFLRQIIDWFGTPFAAWLRDCTTFPCVFRALFFHTPRICGGIQESSKNLSCISFPILHISNFILSKNYSFCNSFSRICNVEYLFCSDSL